ncbi:MAG TPA: hypothetical protein VKZ78_00090 [Sphingobacteriaceae bacterium]|nr:hypothetical protein [Sphingobacteriaceae bacterium]
MNITNLVFLPDLPFLSAIEQPPTLLATTCHRATICHRAATSPPDNLLTTS